MSNSYPDSVLTKNRSGRSEVRALDSKGKFVIAKYLDSDNLKESDKKRKLVLKKESGEIQEFFIIPTKQNNKSLLITPKKKSKKHSFWDEELEKVVEL